MTVALAAVNRDLRVFADPDRLDLLRPATGPAHLGYAHGPHFCLGAAMARVQVQVALAALSHRFPDLALARDGVHRVLDPGAWRLDRLMVTANDETGQPRTARRPGNGDAGRTAPDQRRARA